jgi:hypothetical protein
MIRPLVVAEASDILVSLGFRIDASRQHFSYRIDNIVGPQSASDDDRNAHALYDLPVDLPTVGYTERADLYVSRSMAV